VKDDGGREVVQDWNRELSEPNLENKEIWRRRDNEIARVTHLDQI